MMRGTAGTILRYVALILLGCAVGFLVVRLLLPLVLERRAVFLAVPILLIAILLSLRAVRRVRGDS
jgi:high-affinity Fe2+/Pb2+ permease